jgi:outer membrane protein OmpA-like peptidoglycan-associated protein
MKMALLAGSVALLPVVAMAQPVDGLYVGAGFGLNMLQNETVKGFTSGPTGTVAEHSNPKFDPGFAGVVSLGYGLGNGLRVEIEGDYRQNQLRSVGGSVLGDDGHGGGHEDKYGAMANVLYDVDLSGFGIGFMTPYIGFGGGYMQNDWKTVSAGGPPAELTVNKAADGFAVQGIVGAAFPLTDLVPGLDLTVEYRLMDMPDSRKYSAILDTPAGPVAGKLKVADDFNHSAMIGLRYALFQPPPPPPPAAAPAPVAAPAPAPTRTYLVFFDWDKAELTERARQIISQAAQNSTRVQYTRIEVNGYTDLSGTPAYNQTLSVRRAESVAAELVTDGVPKTAIDIQGFGETHPLVPTAAGVREPQNRRVEIILK